MRKTFTGKFNLFHVFYAIVLFIYFPSLLFLNHSFLLDLFVLSCLFKQTRDYTHLKNLFLQAGMAM